MSNNSTWATRNVRSDGEVPAPVLLAIAMRPYAERRVAECARASNEGAHAKICNKCPPNSRVRCAVCREQLAFLHNAAQIGKHCAGRMGCVKGGGSASHAAFVCDSCKMAFSGQCVRTSQLY